MGVGKSAIGRTGSHRSFQYLEPRGSAALTGPFARNFAGGPLLDTTIPIAGIEVPWFNIYSGAVAGVNVPITPIATGRIRVSGVLGIKNNDSSNHDLTLVIRIGAITLAFPFLEGQTLVTGTEAVPFLGETATAEAFPVGVTTNVRIFVTSTSDINVELVAANSTIEVQEVPAPTG